MLKATGFLGKAGSGKDLVAGFLMRRGHVKVALADPLKRLVMQLFGATVTQLWGPSEMRSAMVRTDTNNSGGRTDAIHTFVGDLPVTQAQYTDLVNAIWDWALQVQRCQHVSVRHLLQTLGTEVGRGVSPTLWVDYLFERVLPHLEAFDYDPSRGLVPRSRQASHLGVPAGVVISDVRFANEVRAVMERGGRVFRLVRPGRPSTTVAGGIAGHASEAEQDGIPDDALTGVLEMPEGLDRVEEYLRELAKKRVL